MGIKIYDTFQRDIISKNKKSLPKCSLTHSRNFVCNSWNVRANPYTGLILIEECYVNPWYESMFHPKDSNMAQEVCNLFSKDRHVLRQTVYSLPEPCSYYEGSS